MSAFISKSARNSSMPLLLLCALLLSTFSSPLFGQNQVVLGGTITGIDGSPLVNVPVRLLGDVEEYTHTDATGYYEFNVWPGQSYEIEPSSSSNPLEGLSTLDLVIMEKHLLGLEPIDNPYKLLAADVDLDNTVSAFDILQVNELILWLIPEFSSGKSWRFIDASFTFPNSSNPWQTVFPETYVTGEAFTDMTDIDFVGVKLGDLNCSGTPVFNDHPCDFGCGKLVGTVYYDMDGNCALDGTENNLQNWVVVATSANEVQYAISDSEGKYSLNLEENVAYEITSQPINSLWTTCNNSQTVTLLSGEILELDILAQSLEDCHQMSVDLSASFLRRCFENNYAVQYCNFGTVTAPNASVEVNFDEHLEIISSNVPWTNQNGNSLTWDVGDVAANECQTFLVKVKTSCDAELGETLCSEATVTPLTDCTSSPNWDGSNLEVSAACVDDEVQFEIINTGDPMLESLNYIVIEDDMIMMMDNSSGGILATNEVKQLNLPANGRTIRLEVEQNNNHPISPLLSVTVEGCGEDTNGATSQGFVNAFPIYGSSAGVSTDCSVVIGSFDPNDKAALPTGAQDEHFIEQNIDLDYTIRFQNTGTDTAFLVFIRDTLSSHLDVSTFRPGPSSHDYQYSIINDNIIEFVFPEIMLPDSFVNEPASNGFVKFHLAQQPDNPIGTLIENRAAIYFDFNEAVITNTVFHTVGEDFLEIVNSVNDPGSSIQLSVVPNPMTDFATIRIQGGDAIDATIQVYDTTGKTIYAKPFRGLTHKIYKDDLAAGTYLFRIVNKDQVLSNGKLIVQ